MVVPAAAEDAADMAVERVAAVEAKARAACWVVVARDVVVEEAAIGALGTAVSWEAPRGAMAMADKMVVAARAQAAVAGAVRARAAVAGAVRARVA